MCFLFIAPFFIGCVLFERCINKNVAENIAEAASKENDEVIGLNAYMDVVVTAGVMLLAATAGLIVAASIVLSLVTTVVMVGAVVRRGSAVR